MTKVKNDMLQRMQDQVKELQSHIAKLEKRPASRSRGKSGKQVAPKAKQPFPGFDKLASGDRKGSLKIIRAQSPEALRAGIKAEKSGRGRKQVTAWMKETLDRLEAGLPATPRRGRPSGVSKPRRAKRAPRAKRVKRAKPKMARRRGRPSLSERPHKMKGRPPVAGFESWSITESDPAGNMRKQILALSDPRQVKSLLAFEKRQPRPRSTVVGLLERRLRALQGSRYRGGRVALPKTGLPFPGYEKVASSRQKQSRRILAARSLPELNKALSFEEQKVGRVQVEEMIRSTIASKQAKQRKLPFPGYEKVASANLTLTRQLLRGVSDKQLQAARVYEQQGRHRVQVLRAIDAEEKQRTRPSGRRRGRPPVSAARPRRKTTRPVKKPTPKAKQPFPGFDKLASGDRKGSLKIIRAQSPEALRAGIKAEKSGRGRKQVTAWMKETLDRLEAGLPATPRRGRPEKVPAGKQPFPGYEKVSTSNLSEARQILSSRSTAELKSALAFERKGKARNTIITLEERLISQKGTTKRVVASKPPFEDYDALPEAVICRTVERGMLDDSLSEIVAYEKRGKARKGIIKAAQKRLKGEKPASRAQAVAV